MRAGECGHLLLCPRWVLACGHGGRSPPWSPRPVGMPAAPGRVPVAESSGKNMASGAQWVVHTASRAPPRPGPQPPASPDTQTHDSGWGCGAAPEAGELPGCWGVVGLCPPARAALPPGALKHRSVLADFPASVGPFQTFLTPYPVTWRLLALSGA